MKRKVVKHGSATLTVSLPSKWVKRFGIKPGEELEVTENNRSIIISTDKNYALKRTVIDLSEIGLFNKNFLSNVYQMGFDEVELRYNDVKTLNQIMARLNHCIGFEIVDQGAKYCIIKSIAKISDTEFDKVLSRTFLILLSMAKDCRAAIEEKDYSRLKEIRPLEAANNKLTDYCRRILNKKGYPDPKKTIILYSLVHDLEKVADDYKHICDLLEHHDKPISKDVMDIFADVNDFLETFYQLYYKFDVKKKEKIFNYGKVIHKKAFELMKKKKDKELFLLHHLINLTSKIYELTLPYFQMRF